MRRKLVLRGSDAIDVIAQASFPASSTPLWFSSPKKAEVKRRRSWQRMFPTWYGRCRYLVSSMNSGNSVPQCMYTATKIGILATTFIRFTRISRPQFLQKHSSRFRKLGWTDQLGETIDVVINAFSGLSSSESCWKARGG